MISESSASRGTCAMLCHVVPLALIRKEEGQLSARLPRRSLAEGLDWILLILLIF